MIPPFPEHIRHAAIISPAGPVDRQQLKKNCVALTETGLEEITIMPHACAGSGGGYLSSDIKSRAEDIHACWRNPDIDLIIASRGGYGSAKLLPHLDWKLMKTRAIPVLGYSDITALHLAMISKQVGIPIAAPMAVHMQEALKDPLTTDWLAWSLREGKARSRKRKVFKMRPTVLKAGSAEGKILPVNLTVLCSLVGTPYLPDLCESILLLEDIHEPVYKVDRCLTQLLLSGGLTECCGVIFGDFRRCGNKRERACLFGKIAGKIKGPVISGFPFGHFLPMACLRYNAHTRISSNGEVEFS